MKLPTISEHLYIYIYMNITVTEILKTKIIPVAKGSRGKGNPGQAASILNKRKTFGNIKLQMINLKRMFP